MTRSVIKSTTPFIAIIALAVCIAIVCTFTGCQSSPSSEAQQNTAKEIFSDDQLVEQDTPEEQVDEATLRQLAIDEALGKLNLTTDFRSSFVHGEKGSEFQKYIVLHDTEGDADASSVINWWDSNGNLVAAHFVVNKDGSIVQCAPLDTIVHHAGFGDTGHNQLYGVEDESRDDMLGTVPIGSWASDYGMNSHSIGIEMVHVGGSGDYPEAQLIALDNLIAYIDAYYGFDSQIIDHKAWRSGNSDTSAEFANYFENYKNTRTHNGQ